MASSRRVYTPREVFEQLKIGRTVGYALLASGEIPSIKIGRQLRVREEDLAKFLEKRLTSAAW